MTRTNFKDKLSSASASFQHAVLTFKDDLRGLSGIEFAMIAPMLVGVYLGVAETALGVTNSRKVSRVASTLADLVAQTRIVTAGDLDGIMNAAISVMAPYSSTGLLIKITGVEIDADGNTSVVWSRASSGNGATAGDSYPIPDDIKLPGTFLVVSNVTYDYTPNLGANLIGTYSFNETSYNVPRLGATVGFSN